MLLMGGVVVVVVAMDVVAHAICAPRCVHRIGQFDRVFKSDDCRLKTIGAPRKRLPKFFDTPIAVGRVRAMNEGRAYFAAV